jgi:putative transposase
MKSDTLAQLLGTLGIDQSFSRPHVSDDNAFSEAQFKTLKYQPDYPGRFAGVLHSRGWLEPFFGWHNDEHHHSGLALFTPAEVFFARVTSVHAVRQAALDAAYALHPERFPQGAPVAALPPTEVSINPLESLCVSVEGEEQSQSMTPSAIEHSGLNQKRNAIQRESEIAKPTASRTPRRASLAVEATATQS